MDIHFEECICLQPIYLIFGFSFNYYFVSCSKEADKNPLFHSDYFAIRYFNVYEIHKYHFLVLRVVISVYKVLKFICPWAVAEFGCGKRNDRMAILRQQFSWFGLQKLEAWRCLHGKRILIPTMFQVFFSFNNENIFAEYPWTIIIGYTVLLPIFYFGLVSK